MAMQQQTILVTGATGFIGRAMCDFLARHGVNVRAAVRGRASGLPAGVVPVSVGNIDGKTSWDLALEGVVAVIHLAGRAHVLDAAAAQALDAFRTVNRDGTLNLFKSAQRAGVGRMVNVSSIGVYGPSTRGDERFQASSNPRPYNAYSQSKWEADEALIATRTGPTEVVIVRPPLVYGPGNGGNFLRLLKVISRGLPLPLRAATAPRDMIYVDNLVDALWRCTVHPGAAGRVYVACDGSPFSTAQLVQTISVAMGRPDRTVHVPQALLRMAAGMVGRRDDIGRLLNPLRIDDTAIRTELQWIPPVTAEDGIRRTVEWFCQNYRTAA